MTHGVIVTCLWNAVWLEIFPTLQTHGDYLLIGRASTLYWTCQHVSSCLMPLLQKSHLFLTVAVLSAGNFLQDLEERESMKVSLVSVGLTTSFPEDSFTVPSHRRILQMTWIYFSFKKEICFIDVIPRTHRVGRNIQLCWSLSNQVSFLSLESLSNDLLDLYRWGSPRQWGSVWVCLLDKDWELCSLLIHLRPDSGQLRLVPYCPLSTSTSSLWENAECSQASRQKYLWLEVDGTEWPEHSSPWSLWFSFLKRSFPEVHDLRKGELKSLVMITSSHLGLFSHQI